MESRANVIAIVGASGFLGGHLVEKLRQLGGRRIKLLTRTLDTNAINDIDIDVEWCKGDLQDSWSLQNFLERDCIVINLAYLWGAGEAANLAAATNLIEACKLAKIKRLIQCSTADVVGRVTGDLIDEDVLCQPVTEYGATKLKVEQLIASGGKGFFDVTILRPTAVFGPGGGNLIKLAGDIIAGGRLKNYLKSCMFGKRRMNLVPVADVVGAIIFVMRRDIDLDGEIFIVSDDDSPINNFANVEKFLMKEFQVGEYLIPRIHLPLGLLAFLLRVMGKDNVNPRRNYDPRKLKDIGFERIVRFETALAEYASWYRSSELCKAIKRNRAHT